MTVDIDYALDDVLSDSLTALLRIAYDLNGNKVEWTARIELKDSGLTTINIPPQVSSEDARYVAKNVASILREIFSPLYADSHIWNDRFGISSRENQNEAIRDMADQMIRTSEDNVMLIQSWSDKRTGNHYSLSAENLVSEDDIRKSKSLDSALRIKAHANILNTVSSVDTFIDEKWRIAQSYLQACRWFVSIFDLGVPIQNTFCRHLELATSAYETTSHQHRNDYDAFGADAAVASIEMADVSRRQADSMDRMSFAVLGMTVVTTILSVSTFVLDHPFDSLAVPAVTIAGAATSSILIGLAALRKHPESKGRRGPGESPVPSVRILTQGSS